MFFFPLPIAGHTVGSQPNVKRSMKRFVGDRKPLRIRISTIQILPLPFRDFFVFVVGNNKCYFQSLFVFGTPTRATTSTNMKLLLGDKESLQKATQDQLLNQLADYERQQVDDNLPSSYKERFGEFAFVDHLPVLILHPYDTPFGPQRKQWIQQFEKVRLDQKLSFDI